MHPNSQGASSPEWDESISNSTDPKLSHHWASYPNLFRPPRNFNHFSFLPKEILLTPPVKPLSNLPAASVIPSTVFFQAVIHLFPGGSAGKESACNVGDLGSIPRLGRCPGEGNGYPLQFSGLENSMNCIVHGFTESDTTERLSCSWYIHTVECYSAIKKNQIMLSH